MSTNLTRGRSLFHLLCSELQSPALQVAAAAAAPPYRPPTPRLSAAAARRARDDAEVAAMGSSLDEPLIHNTMFGAASDQVRGRPLELQPNPCTLCATHRSETQRYAHLADPQCPAPPPISCGDACGSACGCTCVAYHPDVHMSIDLAIFPVLI